MPRVFFHVFSAVIYHLFAAADSESGAEVTLTSFPPLSTTLSATSLHLSAHYTVTGLCRINTNAVFILF